MEMVQSLQKQVPAILRSLSEDDIHHLVNLMISDKKWIEESPSDSAPFKLIRTDEKVSCSKLRSNPRPSNGLSSMFSNTEQPSLPEKLRELDGHKKHQDPPNAAVSQPVIEGKYPGKSRNEILADCQKLIDEIVREYPEGFNIGSFRKFFLKKYGYSLDVPKLGYQKLASFLQTLHGVRIESTYIIPSRKVQKSLCLERAEPFVQESNFSGTEANSESEMSDTSGRDDDLDSPWEELGPVAITRGTTSNRKTKDVAKEKIQHDYESLSDDDFSDSEEETSSSMNSEGKKKPRIKDEDSSLLQILDSWYSSKEDNSKEDNNKRDASELLDGVADSVENGSSESSTGSFIKDEIPAVKKQRPSRSYSFITDQSVDSKELIDGILGSLKKTGEPGSKI